MKFSVFKGKLGHETALMDIDIRGYDDKISFPHKGDLIYLPIRNDDDIVDGDTYVVKQVLIDYVHKEYNIFVELYNWED